MIAIWESLKEILNSQPVFKHTIIWSLLFGLLTYLLGVITGWYRNNVFLFRFWLRSLWNILPHKKYVLIWNDDDEAVSENIKALLKQQIPNYRYRVLREPDKLLGYPLDPDYVQIVFLIVSDVTKLAELKSMRDLIQKRLLVYVRKGGNLFGTHDIIYRRCRNKSLQKAFGCEITDFKRLSSPIEVQISKENSNHPLLKGLPDKFNIDDSELCWGKWGNDSKILIRTTDKHENNLGSPPIYIPTLVIRHTGRIGTLIWFNSADKYDQIARSINEPQIEVLKIFENAIKYSDEIKKYDSPV